MLNFSRPHFIKKIITAFLMYQLMTTSAQANSWLEELNINSFISIDATYTNNDINIESSSKESREYDSKKISFENSLLGTQLNYQVSENLNAFIQGALYYDESGEPETSIDWAYLSYDFGNDLTARAGKLQIPFLKGTELRKIGFSRLWARPLIPSNGASGFNDFTGVELLKSIAYHDNNFTFQLSLGKPEHGLSMVDGQKMVLLSVGYQQYNFHLRTAIAQNKYAVYSNDNVLINDNSHIRMGSIEAEYTLRNVIGNIGYSTSRSDNTPDDSMQYISIAYQLDTLSPYFFAARKNQFFTHVIPARNANATSPPIPPPNVSPRDGDSDTYNFALGLKWSFSDQHILKAQIENVKIRDKTRISSGIITNEGNVLSLLIEGVF